MSNIFNSVLGSVLTISLGSFMACLGAALGIGIFTAWFYSLHTKSSKGFITTLALLPAVVSVVIMMVNGNVGAGVAVAGAFSLVRFRSAQGSAKEITAIFLAMGSGLIVGMGFIAYAAIFSAVISLAFLIFAHTTDFSNTGEKEKTLTVTIPENLDYTHIFDDIFSSYTSINELTNVKTTNMGSLFKLSYRIRLKDVSSEKEMIDKIRERNGNLEIVVNRYEAIREL